MITIQYNIKNLIPVVKYIMLFFLYHDFIGGNIIFQFTNFKIGATCSQYNKLSLEYSCLFLVRKLCFVFHQEKENNFINKIHIAFVQNIPIQKSCFCKTVITLIYPIQKVNSIVSLRIFALVFGFYISARCKNIFLVLFFDIKQNFPGNKAKSK